MMRTTVRVGTALLLLVFAGCLDKSGGPPLDYYSMLRIRPDYNLESAPDSLIYQLWLLDVDSTFTTQEFTPLARFQWDRENFRALDEDGEQIPLYSQSGPGMDMGINLLGHDIVLVTLEPIDDPQPDQPNGPVVVFYLDPTLILPQFVSPLAANHEAEMSMGGSGIGSVQEGPGGSSFTMLAQSFQHAREKRGEHVCWRDSTQGQGIWFAQTTVRDLVVEDTAGFAIDPTSTDSSGTLFQKDVDQNGDGIGYNIWIFPQYPDSSWSNFDRVFPNRSPNLRFRDSVAVRAPTSLPPPESGMNKLGGNPITIDGATVGYMYFPDTNTLPPIDTCFLRTDHPELTYCTNEPQAIRDSAFADTNLIIREFTTTWADTIVTPSLLSLPGLQPQFGLEYEAWLVFDSADNPLYPPISLGRIRGEPGPPDGRPLGISLRDRSDRFTDADNYDQNFQFPGEDFLRDLPDGFPTPLNLPYFDGAERIKVWITMEPLLFLDWAPNQPFEQLITFVGEVRPDRQSTLDSAIAQCSRRGEEGVPSPYPTLNYPLTYRPISRNRTDLAEGHNWPAIQIFIGSPDEDQ